MGRRRASQRKIHPRSTNHERNTGQMTDIALCSTQLPLAMGPQSALAARACTTFARPAEQTKTEQANLLPVELAAEVTVDALIRLAATAGDAPPVPWVDAISTGLASRAVALRPRECDLIGLLAQGLTNKEIARSLGLTVGTVKVYLSRLLQKVGVSDRLDLALFASKNLAASNQASAAQPARLKWAGDSGTHGGPPLSRRPCACPAQVQRPEALADMATAASPAIRSGWLDRPRARPALPKRLIRGCKCGQCAQCAENARWDRIFSEKFADPHYYTGDYVRQSSPLGDR